MNQPLRKNIDTRIELARELHAVRDKPRLLVLVTHGFLELMVNTVIEKKCKHGKRIAEDTRGYPHSTKLVILNEKELINDALFAALDWFRGLRNRAGHRPFFKFSKNDALEAKKRLAGASLHLDSLGESEESFWHHVCDTLISVLWNTHVEVFREIELSGKFH